MLTCSSRWCAFIALASLSEFSSAFFRMFCGDRVKLALNGPPICQRTHTLTWEHTHPLNPHMLVSRKSLNDCHTRLLPVASRGRNLHDSWSARWFTQHGIFSQHEIKTVKLQQLPVSWHLMSSHHWSLTKSPKCHHSALERSLDCPDKNDAGSG